jgi:hypothetical protein
VFKKLSELRRERFFRLARLRALAMVGITEPLATPPGGKRTASVEVCRLPPLIFNLLISLFFRSR